MTSQSLCNRKLEHKIIILQRLLLQHQILNVAKSCKLLVSELYQATKCLQSNVSNSFFLYCIPKQKYSLLSLKLKEWVNKFTRQQHNRFPTQERLRKCFRTFRQKYPMYRNLYLSFIFSIICRADGLILERRFLSVLPYHISTLQFSE